MKKCTRRSLFFGGRGSSLCDSSISPQSSVRLGCQWRKIDKRQEHPGWPSLFTSRKFWLLWYRGLGWESCIGRVYQYKFKYIYLFSSSTRLGVVFVTTVVGTVPFPSYQGSSVIKHGHPDLFWYCHNSWIKRLDLILQSLTATLTSAFAYFVYVIS